MVKNEIHLLQADRGSWLVTKCRWRPPRRDFRSRPHAVEIVVHGPDGSQARENPPSLRDDAAAAPSAEDGNDVLFELLVH